MIRAMDKWLGSYLAQKLRPRPLPADGPLHICLAVADHFEPWWANPCEKQALARLATWERDLPRLVDGLADCRGKPPQHDFFYPIEDYRPRVMDRLAALCAKGLGQVEVHLHHHGESSAELEDLLSFWAQTLHQEHGLLRKDPNTGQIAYGFVHGNWALDNSRPDGTWCGRNDEISILARTGCYADFTMPSAPDVTQTRTINAIYYATDDPDKPKSHDTGVMAQVGRSPSGDLLLVQGVLGLNWRRRKWGIVPHIENSDLSANNQPDPGRAALWLSLAPCVKGAEHVRFIKLHCHGAPEQNARTILGQAMRHTLEHLLKCYNDGETYKLAFMTCWEMVQTIHALEKGESLKW